MANEKEYVVVVHRGIDLESFDAELAAETGTGPIPNRSVEVAKSILYYDIGIGLTDGSDHYHTHQVNPAWNEAMMFIITIGNHKFYKYY